MGYATLNCEIRDILREIKYVKEHIHCWECYNNIFCMGIIVDYKFKALFLQRKLSFYYEELKKELNKKDISYFDDVIDKALESLNGVLIPEYIEQYKVLLENSKTIEECRIILDEINDLVRNNYINRITDVNTYKQGDDFNFICHSVSFYDETYDEPNYVSCSLLSNKSMRTYWNSCYGLIYSPEYIVAADSKDMIIDNNALLDEFVSYSQAYPTILNMDDVISNTRNYNEVVVKKSKPIGIFYIPDHSHRKNDDYKSFVKKHRDLKVIKLHK